MPAEETQELDIRWLKGRDDEKFFPVTHIRGVRNTENESLETILGRKQDKTIFELNATGTSSSYYITCLPEFTDSDFNSIKAGNDVKFVMSANAAYIIWGVNTELVFEPVNAETANNTFITLEATDISDSGSIETGEQCKRAKTYGIRIGDVVNSDLYSFTALTPQKKIEFLDDVEITLTDNSEQTYFENAVQDYDGNWYDAVIIGYQVWLAENMRATHYSDGTAITFGGNNSSNSTPYYYHADNDATNDENYGLLYNWPAAMKGASSSSYSPSGVQGIAPDGWHIPSDNELTLLLDYLKANSDYWADGVTNTAIAKSLASTIGWNTSTTTNAVGNDLEANNITGFSAMPAGFVWNFQSQQTYTQAHKESRIWSTTTSQSNNAYVYALSYGSATFNRQGSNNSNYSIGQSVRCVYDGTPSEFRAKMKARELDGQILKFNKEKGKWVNSTDGGGEGQETTTDVTYDELVSLRDSGELVPNRKYRITDYVTSINPYKFSIWPELISSDIDYDMLNFARVSLDYKYYDIVVTAIDETHLSEDARMEKHDDETYFDEFDLPSWKLKYTLDNDISNYEWACNYHEVSINIANVGTVDGVLFCIGKTVTDNNTDYNLCNLYMNDQTTYGFLMCLIEGDPETGKTIYNTDGASLGTSLGTISAENHVTGKGVVYYMEDMNGNKINYDYINIQYKLYAIEDTNDSDLDDTYLVYDASNSKYGRFISLYHLILNFENSLGEVHIEPNLSNYDWYYTFDKLSGPSTHTNVFYKCHGVEILNNPASCYTLFEIGYSTWTLPSNVFQFGAENDFMGIMKTCEFAKNIKMNNGSNGNVIYFGSYDANGTSAYKMSNMDFSQMYGNIFIDSFYLTLKNSMRCIYIKTDSVIMDDPVSNVFYKNNQITMEGFCTGVFIKNSRSVKIMDNCKDIKVTDSSNSSIGRNSQYITLIGCNDIKIGDSNNRVYLNGHNINCSELTTGFNVHNVSNAYENDSRCAYLENITIGNYCSDIRFLPETDDGIPHSMYNCTINNCCSNIYCYSNTNSAFYNIYIKSNRYSVNGNSMSVNLPLTLNNINNNTTGLTTIGVNSEGTIVYAVEEDFAKPSFEPLEELTLTTTNDAITINAPQNRPGDVKIYYAVGTPPLPTANQENNANTKTLYKNSFSSGDVVYFRGYYTDNMMVPPTPILTYTVE